MAQINISNISGTCKNLIDQLDTTAPHPNNSPFQEVIRTWIPMKIAPCGSTPRPALKSTATLIPRRARARCCSSPPTAGRRRWPTSGRTIGASATATASTEGWSRFTKKGRPLDGPDFMKISSRFFFDDLKRYFSSTKVLIRYSWTLDLVIFQRSLW